MFKKYPKSRRKQWIINPKFQFRFLLYTEGIALVIFALNLGLNFFYFQRLEAKLGAMGLAPNHLFFVFLERQQTHMTGLLIGFGLVIVAILTVYGILLSHRIAGPLYGLRIQMKKMIDEGVSHDISFRRKDFFAEIPEHFNQVIRLRYKDEKSQDKSHVVDESA